MVFPLAQAERLGIAGLNHLASDLADERFHLGPQLFNELLNRDEPSSNAVKAQRDLMRRMIDGDGKPRLGIEGYPAEAGLCESILLSSSLYSQDEHGLWHFAMPDATTIPPMSLRFSLLRSRFCVVPTQHFLSRKSSICGANRPFGAKSGLMPIFALAMYLANRNELAVYRQGVFQPNITELDIELIASDPGQIHLGTWP